MLLNCGVGEDSWESLGLQRDPTRKSVLNIHWKDWCWSWNSNTLAIWCKELTHWKISWWWERLKAGEERDDRGWDGCMASRTRWTWIWVNCGSWWWTGRPGALRFMGSQRVGHDWVTELNWTEWPEEFLFWYPIILPFHTIHGVLKARILKWLVIPFSSGPHSPPWPARLGLPCGLGLVSLS